MKRLGASRPEKDIKVIDLAEEKMGHTKSKNKRLRNVGPAM